MQKKQNNLKNIPDVVCLYKKQQKQGIEDMSAVATLKKGEGRTLKAGGMWVYDNEIDTVTGTFENGDIVKVQDFDGYAMGSGFINLASKIRIRMMTRKDGQEIDRDFIRMRVQNAWNYRKQAVDTGSCRIIFGEADFLPGIVIDKFSDVLVVESLALGIDWMKDQIVQTVKDVLASDGIMIRGVYERSDAKVREQEGMSRKKGFLGEEFETNVPIEKWGKILRRRGKWAENGIFSGSEVQQTGNSQILQRCRCAGLLYTYRIVCPECGAGRRKKGTGRRCIRKRDCAGEAECTAERAGRSG